MLEDGTLQIVDGLLVDFVLGTEVMSGWVEFMLKILEVSLGSKLVR